MKTTIDLQTLIGFFSATGVPALIKTVITLVHPSIYTLTCGVPYASGAADCYKDAVLEAWLTLILILIAVGYGVWTLWKRLVANPTPTNTAEVPTASGGTVTISTVAAPKPPQAP
jgi:hypothetical protein